MVNKDIKINLYNSLTRKIEEFKPIEEGKISMYVCGPTVYNDPSIGNMRPVVVFDTLRRFFTYLGYDVTYVSNYTDVDDRIINRAIRENISEKELSEKYIDEFLKVIHQIGSKTPSITPRVTEYMDKIISYIDNLIKIGAAYEVNGNVYFRVSKIKDYGALSNISTDELLKGARVEENLEKESPLDFALWKNTDVGIKWDSPFGKGRPGWHTECCVMIDSIFGRKIDIHGGGYDLKFPHHENEIAQAEATHNNKIANYWIHNGFININGEKMSKSLGNIILAKDLVTKVGGPIVRLTLISVPYRQMINFSDDLFENSMKVYSKITSAFKQLSLYVQLHNLGMDGKPSGMDKFLMALGDDLNTSNALTELFEAIKEGNNSLRSREIDNSLVKNSYLKIKDMCEILGLDLNEIILSNEDLDLYKKYNEAKINKDFATSDSIRSILIEKKIL